MFWTQDSKMRHFDESKHLLLIVKFDSDFYVGLFIGSYGDILLHSALSKNICTNSYVKINIEPAFVNYFSTRGEFTSSKRYITRKPFL